MNYRISLAVCIAAFCLHGCGGSSSDNAEQPEPTTPEVDPVDTAFLSTSALGGETSIANMSHNAFSKPAANLPTGQRADFEVGDALFNQAWVSAPATTTARDGLGPFFNTNGCQSCHIKDGRGHAPEPGEDDFTSLLVRVSIEDSHPDATNEAQTAVLNGEAAVIAHPVFGGQIQDRALIGYTPEASLTVGYETSTFTYPDGETVELRKPTFTITGSDGTVAEDILQSPRIAPPMIGLGLLESITEADIQALADENDADSDGISGRPNLVMDVVTQQQTIGRFGWKAGQPNLNQQNAGAFNGDMGLTTHLFPNVDCTSTQTECLAQANAGATDGDAHEVTPSQLEFVEIYTRHLAVPNRRDINDEDVNAGYYLFKQVNCQGCHTISFTTGDIEDAPALSNQVIFPFTDMLLHDMGGDLADNRSEFIANGQEWRTPALWGIGLTTAVNNGKHPDGFLHDGRAQTIEQAILWHGGEAQNSRDAFTELTSTERAQLLTFLESI